MGAMQIALPVVFRREDVDFWIALPLAKVREGVVIQRPFVHLRREVAEAISAGIVRGGHAKCGDRNTSTIVEW